MGKNESRGNEEKGRITYSGIFYEIVQSDRQLEDRSEFDGIYLTTCRRQNYLYCIGTRLSSDSDGDFFPTVE